MQRWHHINRGQSMICVEENVNCSGEDRLGRAWRVLHVELEVPQDNLARDRTTHGWIIR